MTAATLEALRVIIELGGAIQVQLGAWSAIYDDPSDAATDVGYILDGADPIAGGWTSNAKPISNVVALGDSRLVPHGWKVWIGQQLADPPTIARAALDSGWPNESAFLSMLAAWREVLRDDEDAPAMEPQP